MATEYLLQRGSHRAQRGNGDTTDGKLPPAADARSSGETEWKHLQAEWGDGDPWKNMSYHEYLLAEKKAAEERFENWYTNGSTDWNSKSGDWDKWRAAAKVCRAEWERLHNSQERDTNGWDSKSWGGWNRDGWEGWEKNGWEGWSKNWRWEGSTNVPPQFRSHPPEATNVAAQALDIFAKNNPDATLAASYDGVVVKAAAPLGRGGHVSRESVVTGKPLTPSPARPPPRPPPPKGRPVDDPPEDQPAAKKPPRSRRPRQKEHMEKRRPR